jgi:drug/metabolite transporter (DMT)-like permease
VEIVLGLGAALSYGAADFVGGLVSRRAAVLSVVFVSQLTGFALLLAVLPLLEGGRPTATALWWGAGAGIGGGVGISALYHGLATGRMSVVAPTTAVVAAAVPVVFGLASGERPGPIALAGVAVALLAIALVSFSTRGADPRVTHARAGIGHAVLAGAGFGAFFIGLERAGQGSGLWPLVGARLSSLALVALLIAVTRSARRPGRGTGRAIVAAGALDVAANVLYVMAARRGLLTLVAVLTSLYPASTVLLARIVLGERLTRLRLVGLGAALVGVSLMALG